jgi:hypothetical protein
VVGVSQTGTLSLDQAFRWTVGGGMGWAICRMTADGSVVVGGSTTANDVHNWQATRWTQNGGIVGLGDGLSPGDKSSASNAVNANGSVGIGCSGLNGACNHLFLWTAAYGIKSVQARLTAKGVSTTSWTLTSSQGLSADGQVIVGSTMAFVPERFMWVGLHFPPLTVYDSSLCISDNFLPDIIRVEHIAHAVGEFDKIAFDGSFWITFPFWIRGEASNLRLVPDTERTITSG